MTSEGVGLDGLALKTSAGSLEQLNAGSPTASKAGHLGGVFGVGARPAQPHKSPPLPYIPPQPSLAQQPPSQQQQQQGCIFGQPNVAVPTAGGVPQCMADEIGVQRAAEGLGESPTSEMGGDIGFTSKVGFWMNHIRPEEATKSA